MTTWEMSSKVLLLAGALLSIGASATSQLIPHGSSHSFDFMEYVVMYDKRHHPEKTPSYRLQGKISISSVWNANSTQLLHFEYDPLQLSVRQNAKEEFSNKKSPLDDMPKQSFYLVLEADTPVQFLTTEFDYDVSTLNFKRGIANFFQFKLEDAAKTEGTSFGSCSDDMHLQPDANRYRKFVTDSSNWDVRLNVRDHGPLGVSKKSYQEMVYELHKDGHLRHICSTEKHSIFINAKQDVGATVESIMQFNHLSNENTQQKPEKDLEAVLGSLEGYKTYGIESTIDGNLSKINGNLKSLIKSSRKNMEDEKIGTQTAAFNLVKLLPTARITRHEEFMQILKAHSTKTIQKQLIDLLGATQTDEANFAMTEVYKFGLDENLDNLERFLQSLAVGKQPTSDVIELLKSELHEASKNEKLIDTTIQALSAVTGRYAQISPGGYEDKIVEDISIFLLSELANCEAAQCKEVYIRGLQNLRDPNTIPDLLDLAVKEGPILSVAAMKALRSFDIKYFTDKQRKAFERIFYQTKKIYDSSARTLALDILLDMKPTKEELTNLLLFLGSYDDAFEVKTYLWQKVQQISGKCPRFAALVEDIWRKKPELNNYGIMAQKGLTTVLERTLSTSPSFNETLLSTQETKSGVLKRGVVDMFLGADGKEVNTFKLGLYTKGLASFVKGSEEETNTVEEEEEEVATAGMEISVHDVVFRPLVFFNGQSELMSHVWSGTASEPTPAYQATTLLQDHAEYVVLQNGATVYVNVLGAKSVDLNGQVQFSLWNRNAHTEIVKNYATALQGSMILGTSYITTEIKFSAGTDPKINLEADIDFYSGVKLCLRLSRPDSSVWHKSVKTLSIPRTNYELKKALKVTHRLPGITLALNRKNNEMCNRIFA